MTMKAIGRMSEDGAVKTLDEILDGLKLFNNNNTENAHHLLSLLVPVLNDLDGDDFFGTEGWEHYFGMSE